MVIKEIPGIVHDTAVISKPKKDSAGLVSPVKKPKKEFNKSVPERISMSRITEGVNDSKMNGEPILIQEDLKESVVKEHPDTIRHLLKSYYLNAERLFPRSIADNFEAGISTERISYPKLNFVIEIFENEYAKKPYKTIRHSVRKENEEIVLE